MKRQFQAAMARMLTTLEQKVDPRHTALLVVNMQNDFCCQGGSADKEGRNLAPVQSMIPNLIAFIGRARQASLPIVYVQSVYAGEKNIYLSDVWLEQMRRAGKGGHVEYPVCQRNSWGADFCPGVKPLPGEAIVTKHRYSGFIDTDLDLILRSKGVRTLIMSGVATNVCVETTARDGFMKDYYIVLLSDCTACQFKEAHDLSLLNIAGRFGEVVESERVVKCWEKRRV